MLIEAAVAIGSGVAAHSLSLIAFGADSLVDWLQSVSSCLDVEMRRGAEGIQRGEVTTTSRCWTRPAAPTNSTIKAAAISKIPEMMKASK